MQNTVSRSRIGSFGLAALSVLLLGQGASMPRAAPVPRAAPLARAGAGAQSCTQTVQAKVVALDQAFYVNRFGALQAGGMVFALERDVISLDGGTSSRPAM